MRSTEDSGRPKRSDREVLRAEDFSESDLEAIAVAKVPDEFAYLDAALKDWTA